MSTVGALTRVSGLAGMSRRAWLATDAVVTGACAVIYLLAAPVLVDLLGSDVGTTRALGGFLLGFTVVVALTASRPSWAAVHLVVAVNAVWVVASLVVAATGALDLTAVGRIWAVAQAGVVGVLAVQQARTT